MKYFLGNQMSMATLMSCFVMALLLEELLTQHIR